MNRPSLLAEQLRAAPTEGTPPYVARNVDGELEEALRSNRFVVVAGRSKVGKSRTAVEALKRVHPDAEIIVPSSPAALQEILELEPPLELTTEPTVLWLDDLDDYFEAGTLVIGALEAILAREDRLLVVGTVRIGSLSRLRSGEDEAGRAARNLLLLAREVVVRQTPDSWDEAEAAALYPRADFSAAGIGAFFAAVEELIRRYQAGSVDSPVGEATVRAAVDWRRAGFVRPIPRSSLEDLVAIELEGAAPGTLNYESAVAWANDPVSSSARLLSFVDEDGGGFLAADPIIEYDDATRPVPQRVWEYVHQFTGDPLRSGTGV